MSLSLIIDVTRMLATVVKVLIVVMVIIVISYYDSKVIFGHCDCLFFFQDAFLLLLLTK